MAETYRRKEGSIRKEEIKRNPIPALLQELRHELLISIRLEEAQHVELALILQELKVDEYGLTLSPREIIVVNGSMDAYKINFTRKPNKLEYADALWEVREIIGPRVVQYNTAKRVEPRRLDLGNDNLSDVVEFELFRN